MISIFDVRSGVTFMYFFRWPTARTTGFSILVAATLLAAGIASAQEEQLEYNFLGAGARANGMGDAFVAVADDATAIFWNPAGLYLLDQPETSFGFQFVSETVEQTRQRRALLLTSNDRGGTVGLNFASFVFPKRFGQKKFVFAFAIQKAFDFTGEFLEVEARAPLLLDQESSSGGPFGYSGGVAFSPFQGLMLGLSASIYRGSADIEESQITTVGELLVSVSDTVSIPVNGTSLGIGALYDFQPRGGPPLRLGFKFAPNFSFSGKIDTDLTFQVADSQGIVNSESLQADFDYVLDFPLDLGFGAAWNPRRDVLVAADFEHRRLRNAALSVIGAPDVDLDEDGNLVIQRGDRTNALSDSGADLNQWRVGVEWSWVNALTVIPIRFGAKNLPQRSADEQRFIDAETGETTTSFGDQVVGTALTGGLGFVTDSFVFDFSVEYGRWSQEIVLFDSEGSHFQESKTRRLALKTSVVIYF